MTENSEKSLEEQFKDGLDPDSPHVLAERVKVLEEENAKLKEDRDAGQIETLTNERDAAIARAEAAEAALKAKPKAVAAKPATPRARKFKPIAEDKVLALEDLKELAGAAEEAEIVFVDDKGREIPGSQPVIVSGDVWRRHALGLMQTEPVEVTGRADGTSYQICGYALLLDGEHVATSMRSEPINVAPGSNIKLVDDIVF